MFYKKKNPYDCKEPMSTAQKQCNHSCDHWQKVEFSPYKCNDGTTNGGYILKEGFCYHCSCLFQKIDHVRQDVIDALQSYKGSSNEKI